jgi:thioredoxin-like negative regulator of GroEL
MFKIKNYTVLALAVLVCLLFGGPCSGFHTPEARNGILSVTKSSFPSLVSLEDFLLIEFFDPRCGDCQAFAPAYDKLSRALLEGRLGFPVTPAKIDASQERELAIQHEIQQVPTLILYKNGTPAVYSGKLDSKKILAWILEQNQ